MTSTDFQPLVRQDATDALVRPSLSYWQNAWRKLRGNRRAIVSLYLVSFLIAFSFVLPALVDFDPYAQDLSQISQAPSLSKTSLIVDTKPWPVITQRHSPMPTADAVVEGLVLGSERATTESVKLRWQAVPGATQYNVYRHILPPSGATDLGLPVGYTEVKDQVSFEDRLKLDTVKYYYSVEAVLNTGELSRYSTLEVRPEHAIGVNDAISRGLISSSERESALGTSVQLKRHIMGTDYLGRDMFSRLVYGGRTSLFIGIVAPFLFITLGIAYGATAGYLGGRVDDLMMRFADFVIALPFLLFMILIRVAMGIGPGESGVTPMLIALVALSWPASARLVRGQVLQIREQAYVQAARLTGASSAYLIMRHMLPNVLGVVLVSLTFSIPTAIFTEAFLSFIGMGVAPPTPSWGAMCNDGVRSFLTHPHELLFPALFISATVLAFNLLGDGLRDALDAKMED